MDQDAGSRFLSVSKRGILDRAAMQETVAARPLHDVLIVTRATARIVSSTVAVALTIAALLRAP